MKIHELFESNNEDLHIKAVNDLKKKLLAKKDDLQKSNNKKLMIEIDRIMKNVAKNHGITPTVLHDAWMDEYHKIPDKWIVNEEATSGGMGVASVASIANPFGIVMHRPSLFGYIPAPKKRKKHKNNK